MKTSIHSSLDGGEADHASPPDPVWITKDKSGNRTCKRLSDCSRDELLSHLKFCEEMLSNPSSYKTGRLIIADRTKSTLAACKAEMLMRWLESEKNYPREKCLDDIKSVIANNSALLNSDTIPHYTIDTIMNGLPLFYSDIPIQAAILAAGRALDAFDPSVSSLSSLERIGICLTEKELRHTLFMRGDDGAPMNRSDVIRIKENLPSGFKIKFKEDGLTYFQFHKALSLKHSQYADLSSSELNFLANTLLPKLLKLYERQAAKWSALKELVISTAKNKNYDLNFTD